MVPFGAVMEACDAVANGPTVELFGVDHHS